MDPQGSHGGKRHLNFSHRFPCVAAALCRYNTRNENGHLAGATVPSEILKNWRHPRFRFEQAGLFHVLRVGGAFLACLLIAAAFPNPHAIWMLISVLAVMGAIQYTGSIGEKVWQRAVGTLIGGLGGVLAVVVDRYISPWGCAALELVIAVTASYLSIGRFGYAALVSGITMVMVANSGDLYIALWRMLNVCLGVGVAQAFAILVPSRACEHWFFLLGDNFRDLSLLYRDIVCGQGLNRRAQESILLRGQKLRALASSACRETHLDGTLLDQVLHGQRSMLALLEVMADECNVWHGVDGPAGDGLPSRIQSAFERTLARFDLTPDRWAVDANASAAGHWLEHNLLLQLEWLDAELQRLLPSLVDWPEGRAPRRYSIGKSK